MRYSYHTADVFTDQRFGGNQLAVLTAAEGLSSADMQQIAREFNYSETVFVLPPEDPAHTCRLRIFTPAEELPFAGHPTIGAAFILAQTGHLATPAGDGLVKVVFEEGAGPVPVEISRTAGRFHAWLTAPRLPATDPDPPSVDTVARVLCLEPEELLTGQNGPQGVSCGVPFLCVPIRSLAAIRRANVDRAAWLASLANSWAPMICAFTRETESAEADLHVRVFCPGLGVEEDPATGSAAATLGAYLAQRDSRTTGTINFVIEQGIEILRPSRIDVAVDKLDGEIVAVRVGGSAVSVMQGEIEVGAASQARQGSG